MAKKKRTQASRHSTLFGSTEGGDRVQGEITPIGSADFESARAELARLSGNTRVSDGNVIEAAVRALARGWEDVVQCLLRRS